MLLYGQDVECSSLQKYTFTQNCKPQSLLEKLQKGQFSLA